MKDEPEVLPEKALEHLIHDIHTRYGYDFRNYSKASLRRRVLRFIQNKNFQSVDELNKFVFKDTSNLESFIQDLTVNVTEMFRDPSFYLSLRKQVIPMLSTYPHIKIWDAGCSTGEELYSLAIVLEEEGLLQRTKIYATDINQKVLKSAKEGIYPAYAIKSYTSNYYSSGGKEEFSKYFNSNYGCVKFNSGLVKDVVFYPHNLATDHSFNEFNLVVCRNVLIYFNQELQQRVFKLFHESLVDLGYLCLGQKETLALSSFNKHFDLKDKHNKIYRKVS